MTMAYIKPRGLKSYCGTVKYNFMQLIMIEIEDYNKLVNKIDQLIEKVNKEGLLKNTDNVWVSGPEVIEMLNISSRTLQNYRDRGIIGFSKIGRKKIFYKRSDVDKLIMEKFNRRF